MAPLGWSLERNSAKSEGLHLQGFRCYFSCIILRRDRPGVRGMNDMDTTAPVSRSRGRAQVMKLTEAAALRITELTKRAEARSWDFASASRTAAAPAILHGRIRPRGPSDRRGRRGQGRKDPGRSQGGAVPARHRDGLQGRQDAVAVHLQQPEPDRRLRLRRIGATDGCEGGWLI